MLHIVFLIWMDYYSVSDLYYLILTYIIFISNELIYTERDYLINN